MRGEAVSPETKEAFLQQLGDRNKKPSKNMRPLEFREYLTQRFQAFPDGLGIQYREGKNHTQATVDGGNTWIALGERHPSKLLKAPTVGAVVKQLDDSKMRLMERGASRSLDPQAWGEEVKALQLVGGAKVYENPSEHGFYSGPILHKDPAARYCVQKIGDKSLAIHDAQKFDGRMPGKGDVVRIKYRNGRAKTSLIQLSD